MIHRIVDFSANKGACVQIGVDWGVYVPIKICLKNLKCSKVGTFWTAGWGDDSDIPFILTKAIVVYKNENIVVVECSDHDEERAMHQKTVLYTCILTEEVKDSEYW